jgi:hypothetical protein
LERDTFDWGVLDEERTYPNTDFEGPKRDFGPTSVLPYHNCVGAVVIEPWTRVLTLHHVYTSSTHLSMVLFQVLTQRHIEPHHCILGSWSSRPTAAACHYTTFRPTFALELHRHSDAPYTKSPRHCNLARSPTRAHFHVASSR